MTDTQAVEETVEDVLNDHERRLKRVEAAFGAALQDEDLPMDVGWGVLEASHQAFKSRIRARRQA